MRPDCIYLSLLLVCVERKVYEDVHLYLQKNLSLSFSETFYNKNTKIIPFTLAVNKGVYLQESVRYISR